MTALRGREDEAIPPGWMTAGGLRTRAPLPPVFNRLVQKLRLPPIRLHNLRHCAAMLSLAAGIHMKTIQVMLGHSSCTPTADTYTSVLPQLELEADDA